MLTANVLSAMMLLQINHVAISVILRICLTVLLIIGIIIEADLC